MNSNYLDEGLSSNTNNIKQIVIVDKPLELLKQMLNHININFNNIDELENKVISRDILLTESIQDQYQKYQLELKKCGYKSGKLTSLHKNNTKQKFPAINMIRQLLKCHNMLMTPKVESIGYNKSPGQKLVKRYFVISKKET